MIDATKLPRASSTSKVSTAPHAAESFDTGVANTGPGGESLSRVEKVQGYPAKSLVIVDGRYRPVAVEK